MKAFIGVLEAADERCARFLIQSAIQFGKKRGLAIYSLCIDDEDRGIVMHGNFVPKEMLRETRLRADAWLNEVKKITGGKVRTSLPADRI